MSTASNNGFERALVIGASMTGLLAARVLADHFARVTVVERDELPEEPENRKGVPQGRHAHALLCRGQQIMEELFPGLFATLVARGAHRIDMGAHAGWLHFGKWKVRHESGLTSYYQSRPLLEWGVRTRVQALPNVEFVRGDVSELIPTARGNGISGAMVTARGEEAGGAHALPADLVVDASGRGSRTPRWLEQLGYQQARETTVRIDGGYATCLYRRPANVPSDRQVVILYPDPPRTQRAGFMFPIEGDRWLVTLGSRFRDYAPEDEAGFLEYARSLAAPDIYDTIRNAEPLSEIISNRYRENLWRHYESLRRAPEGLVVLGDAFCSFNPAYGQGMTVRALEALALDECLRKHRAGGAQSTRGLAAKVQRQAGRIVKMPWTLATSEDFRYAQTEGKRPFWMGALLWYTRKIHQSSAHDPGIYQAFLRVMQMVEPPLYLFRPAVIARLLLPLRPSRPRSASSPSSGRTSMVRAGKGALQGKHAIVIGGGMSGLLAARVLSGHFARVTLIERDELADQAVPRKGVPQGRHVHLLLHRGQHLLERFFPGLFAQMGDKGTVSVDLGRDMRWLRMGLHSTRAVSGVMSQFQTRPALELHVRRRVQKLAAVSFLERTDVCGLVTDKTGKTVTGVQVRSAANKAQAPTTLLADLVVDASGRASHLPRWLEAIGYAPPKQSLVEIDFAYASRIYRRPDNFRGDWKVLICYPDPPVGRRGAYIFPIEDDCWIVTQGSRLGDRPPGDEAGFLEFARSLPHPDVFEAIRNAEPVTPITTFRFPANQRRHYERLRRFPNRLVVLGDAVSSVNPIYGQGMTVCAMEAMALERCLRAHALERAARQFRRTVGRIVEFPWLLITTEDFRYPQTVGKRPPGVDFINWYTRKVHEITVNDPAVLLTLLRVMQMEQHPMTLYRPSIFFKVMALALRGRGTRGDHAQPALPMQRLSDDAGASS